MKAYQIMMFLLLFNLSVSMISALSIYNIGVAVDEEYDVTNYEGDVSPRESDIIAWRFLGATLTGLVTGAIAGAVVAYFTRVPADSGVAYGIFTGTFWGIAYSAIAIFWDIASVPTGGANLALMMLVFIFIGILGVVFAVGLLQLIRGGFKSYV